MDQITVTGAPAIVTALGMGTVFLCLVLLYAITRIVGAWLPRLLESARGEASVEGVESAAEGEAEELPETHPALPVGDAAIAAAATLVLARHRLSRRRSAVEEPKGGDPWKIAGRIRTLRVR